MVLLCYAGAKQSRRVFVIGFLCSRQDTNASICSQKEPVVMWSCGLALLGAQLVILHLLFRMKATSQGHARLC